MAERKAKPKPAPGESGVLASLPTTRPQRIGGKRRATTAAATPATTTEQAAKSAPRRKPAPATKRAAKAKAKAKAPAIPITEAAVPKPKPVRSGAKGLKAPAKRTPPPEKAPSGPELVSTVVQAAGELAQVGLSIGGQVIKRAIERLPKP